MACTLGYLVTGWPRLSVGSCLESNRIDSIRFKLVAGNNCFYQSHELPRGSAWSGPDHTDREINRAAWSLVVERQSALLCTSTKVMRCPRRARADNELVAASVEITSRCLFAPRKSIIFFRLHWLIPSRGWILINYILTLKIYIKIPLNLIEAYLGFQLSLRRKNMNLDRNLGRDDWW